MIMVFLLHFVIISYQTGLLRAIFEKVPGKKVMFFSDLRLGFTFFHILISLFLCGQVSQVYQV